MSPYKLIFETCTIDSMPNFTIIFVFDDNILIHPQADIDIIKKHQDTSYFRSIFFSNVPYVVIKNQNIHIRASLSDKEKWLDDLTRPPSLVGRRGKPLNASGRTLNSIATEDAIDITDVALIKRRKYDFPTRVDAMADWSYCINIHERDVLNDVNTRGL